jgi:polyvinyl alcohol dehydrogenase (cytochrome)
MKKGLLTASLFASAMAVSSWQMASARDWPMFGGSVENQSNTVDETAISPTNVSKLKVKWVATTSGDVSAKAAVVNGVVYFPDWGGNIWALNAATGKAIWHNQISAYGLPAKTVSRTSPAVINGILYIGTQKDANLLALNAATGKLMWKTQLDSHPLAVITGSPAVFDGMVFIGVASSEESAAESATYKCCSFRGSVVAVDAMTGKIDWQTSTVPEGYTGGAVWGSNPVVNAARKLVYIGTGNNYSKSKDPAYTKCIAAGGTEPKCLSPDDHVESLMALDMTTGAVKWANRRVGDDDWNGACLIGDKPGTGNCPKGAGPDSDFGGAGPNEFSIPGVGQVIGAGQKNGVYTVLDADNGKLIWAKSVGPGSVLGGMEWGTATDGRRIYAAISNFDKEKYKAGDAGSWAALNKATGAIEWQVPDPNGTVDIGPMSVSNGVVYAGSMSTKKGDAGMFALDAATGKTLWKFDAGSSVNAGAVVSGGVVYWGSGYAEIGAPFTGNKKFYAFSIGGK